MVLAFPDAAILSVFDGSTALPLQLLGLSNAIDHQKFDHNY